MSENTDEGETVVLRFEIADVEPDDIDIAVRDGNLIVSAQSEHREVVTEGGSTRTRTRSTSFDRSESLPPGAKPEGITANYRDGVLEVTIPT